MALRVTKLAAALVVIALTLIAVGVLAGGTLAQTLGREGQAERQTTAPVKGEGDCYKAANNPHIATSQTDRTAKGFGGIYCGSRHKRLYSEVKLYRTSNGTAGPFELVARASRGSVYNEPRNMIGAQRKCRNRNEGIFYTSARVGVEDGDGVTHRDHTVSATVKLACGF
jgi:hypothetical protein